MRDVQWQTLAPRLSDLSVCDFYLWGNIIGKVYPNNNRTAEALQNKTRNVCASNAADKLQRISQGFFQQCQACLRAEGDQFKLFV
jgi:hypothetical protein